MYCEHLTRKAQTEGAGASPVWSQYIMEQLEDMLTASNANTCCSNLSFHIDLILFPSYYVEEFRVGWTLLVSTINVAY